MSKDGEDLKRIEATFKNATGGKEVTRLIIRTLDNCVDQIKKGRVELYHANSGDMMSRSFDFQNPDNCVLAINFAASGFNSTERNVIENTSKIRVVIDGVHAETKKKRGFKADLFIKKKVVS